MNKKLVPIVFLSMSISIPLIIIFGGIFLIFNFDYDDKLVALYSSIREIEENIVRTEKTVLSEESAIIDVVEKAEDAVVSIAVRQVELDPDVGPQNNNNNIGTGFIIKDDGLIVTNQHVVSDRDSDFVVTTKNRDVYEVSNIYRDEINDLALIRVDTEGKTLPTIGLGDSDELKIGQLVVAIGTPLGDYPGTVTTGIVSGLNRAVTAGSGFWGNAKEYENVIQTDAAINPGNSGGPLLNSNAEVIGINFATTSGADNIAFAIPVNVLKERLEAFEESGGKFVKPYLGVVYETIDEFDAMRFGVPVGAFINEIEDDGPADLGGIEIGDIITEISDQDLGNGLAQAISNFKANDEVEVKVWRKTGQTYRDGEYKNFKVILGEKDD